MNFLHAKITCFNHIFINFFVGQLTFCDLWHPVIAAIKALIVPVRLLLDAHFGTIIVIEGISTQILILVEPCLIYNFHSILGCWLLYRAALLLKILRPVSHIFFEREIGGGAPKAKLTCIPSAEELVDLHVYPKFFLRSVSVVVN